MAVSSESMNMSLDDIIKLRWNRQTNKHPTLNKTRQQFKARNVNQKTEFLTGVLQNQQGPRGLGRRYKQQRYFDSKQSIAENSPDTTRIVENDTSNLNHEETQKEVVHVNNSNMMEPQGQKRFGPKGTTTRRTTAPFNRRSTLQQRQFQRRQNKNLNRGVRIQRTAINAAVRRLKTRRWQVEPEVPASGAILTVNVSNWWANQGKTSQTPAYKQTVLRRRRTAMPFAKRQPRGVFLRFNFRAMGNQTNVTMNERFSTLKTRRNFKAMRTRERTVLFARAAS
ncbi:UAP56-interacting factor-like isoform X2 [Rhinatrema bivittatum]|uniref:UAP56-interacting factor-like isoform X2 n=1 Tax=Rhinatrema bivittatum TaxID=194408 RepID=UPI0011299BD9|nr:UAP56-interacting factor-like isoform X2 [Rhinatrema bivittatum]